MERQSDKSMPRDIQPIVKIMVSPNTPEPDFEESQSASSCLVMDVVENYNSQNNRSRNSSSTGEQQHQNYSTTTTKLTDLFSTGSSALSNKDIPICIDFGIQDYLCRVEEAELDLSSDTDTSYLGASPPHRFSDGEIDPIESMPIILDTHLNFQQEQLPQSDVDEIAKRISLKDINFHKSLFSLHLTSGGSASTPIGYSKTLRRYPKPFRRNISLPAALFSYLLEQQQQNSDCKDHLRKDNVRKDEQETDCKKNSPLPILSRIESISNSSQQDLEDIKTSEYESLRNSIDSLSLHSIGSNWNISVDSEGGEEPPFNSVEKQGLLMRYMRQKLIRQNTDNNFAPPEFCIAES